MKHTMDCPGALRLSLAELAGAPTLNGPYLGHVESIVKLHDLIYLLRCISSARRIRGSGPVSPVRSGGGITVWGSELEGIDSEA